MVILIGAIGSYQYVRHRQYLSDYALHAPAFYGAAEALQRIDTELQQQEEEFEKLEFALEGDLSGLAKAIKEEAVTGVKVELIYEDGPVESRGGYRGKVTNNTAFYVQGLSGNFKVFSRGIEWLRSGELDTNFRPGDFSRNAAKDKFGFNMQYWLKPGQSKYALTDDPFNRVFVHSNFSNNPRIKKFVEENRLRFRPDELVPGWTYIVADRQTEFTGTVVFVNQPQKQADGSYTTTRVDFSALARERLDWPAERLARLNEYPRSIDKLWTLASEAEVRLAQLRGKVPCPPALSVLLQAPALPTAD